MLPEVPEKFLNDRKAGGRLSTLEPVTTDEASEIAGKYKGISAQYLSFIQKIGVGETSDEMYIYKPYEASELTDHDSFRIYNSAPSRRLFGLLPGIPKIKPSLLCVSDVGASWRYCLDLNQPEAVFCFDISDAEIRIESRDFFTFIDEIVLDQEI